MWQRVLPSDSQVVELAFQALAVHNSAWSSASDFGMWLQAHHDRVYYFGGERFQVVVGFRSEGAGIWRGTVAGFGGELSLDAVQELFKKAMSFAEERDAVSLRAKVRKLPPSNVLSQVQQFVGSLARGYPGIESVAASDQGRFWDYTFKLRPAA